MTTSSQTAAPPTFLPDPVAGVCRVGACIRMALWLLRLEDETPRLRFVHGSVLPVRASKRLGGWSSFEVSRYNSKQRLLRYTLEVNAQQAERIFYSLESNPVAVALEREGFGHEELAASDLASIQLKRLPTVYFTGVPQLSGLPAHLWPRTTAVSNFGCYCARFSRPERLAFLPANAEESMAVLQAICTDLALETGLGFSRNAGDAFGSLEVYYYPTLDQEGRPLVEVRYSKPPDSSVCIRILEDEDASYAIEVRGEQLRDTASHELQILPSGTNELTLNLPSPIDGVDVRIWKKRAGAPWQLWHEQEDHFIRTIAMRLQLLGLSGTVGASWLDRLPTRLSSRVESFRQIQQVSVDRPMEVNRREEWEKHIQTARQLVAAANPMQSKSRFFPRGWGSDDSKFEFAEWLKKKLSNHAGSIVLADPYFDLLGLDLVCRASGAAKELIVVTCTQAKSMDDTVTETRAERLRDGAQQYRVVLAGLNLRICDLQSRRSSPSSKQVFHDRYLLLLDDLDGPVEGYNLSTSLQSAATTSPLLLTEIPPDVLPDVSDYVSGLLAPANEYDHSVETLFPNESPRRERLKSDLSEERATRIVAAAKAAGKDVGIGPALQSVIEHGYYQNGKVCIEFDEDELGRAVALLISSPLEEAARVWEGMVESAISGWQDRVPDLVRRMTQISSSEQVADFLVAYLEAHGTGRLLDDNSPTYTRTLSQVLELEFRKSVPEAARFYEHHHDLPLGTSWAIRLGLLFIIESAPRFLDRLVASLRSKRTEASATFSALRGPRKSRPDLAAREQSSKVLANADAVLSAVTAALTSFAQPFGPGLSDAVSQSKEPFARALWAVANGRKVIAGELSPDDFRSKLKLLVSPERRAILGQIVYDLRISANRVASNSQAPKPLPEWIRLAMAGETTSQTTTEELVDLVRLCSGPVLGNWAPSTHEELLEPIVTSGKVSEDALFEVWDSILVERMSEKHVSRSDFELIQVWGACAVRLTTERRGAVLASYEVRLRGAHRTLLEPFLRSRNYEKWLSAANEVLWILLRAWAITRLRPDGTDERVGHLLARSSRDVVIEERLASTALGEMKTIVDFVLSNMDGWVRPPANGSIESG